MAYGTFPFAKFAFLMVKQITNPIHKAIVRHAKKSNILRNYMCLPLAKWYTLFDIRIRYRHQNWKRIQKEAIPDEKNAIETGAYILAEVFMALVISSIIFVEYESYHTKDLKHKVENEEEENSLSERLKGLEDTVHKQSIQLDQLSKILSQLRAIISVRNST